MKKSRMNFMEQGRLIRSEFVHVEKGRKREKCQKEKLRMRKKGLKRVRFSGSENKKNK